MEKLERDRLQEVALNRRGLRGDQGSFEDKIINAVVLIAISATGL